MQTHRQSHERRSANVCTVLYDSFVLYYSLALVRMLAKLEIVIEAHTIVWLRCCAKSEKKQNMYFLAVREIDNFHKLPLLQRLSLWNINCLGCSQNNGKYEQQWATSSDTDTTIHRETNLFVLRAHRLKRHWFACEEIAFLWLTSC